MLDQALGHDVRHERIRLVVPPLAAEYQGVGEGLGDFVGSGFSEVRHGQTINLAQKENNPFQPSANLPDRLSRARHDFRDLRMSDLPDSRIIRSARQPMFHPDEPLAQRYQEVAMGFVLIAAGAIAMFGVGAVYAGDRPDLIRRASAGCLSNQLFPASGSCGAR